MHTPPIICGDLDKRGKSISTLSHLSTGQPAPIIFWYRTSPRDMVAAEFGNDGTVTSDDPAMDISGMVEVELDPQGHLVGVRRGAAAGG